MKPCFFALSLVASLAILNLVPNPVHAQANDMFSTRAAAEKRARELNCSGAFAMGSDWMPCSSFEAYEHAVKVKP